MALGATKIEASDVRYIKLGRAGSWEKAALEGGQLHFGYKEVPHELANSGDEIAIKQFLINNGREPQTATRDAREVLEFYRLDSKCLWITFARRQLWWGYADIEVIWHGGDGGNHGERTRKVIGGWRNTNIKGKVLPINSLSSRLTKVAGYRRTICKIEPEGYLLRRLNAIQEPILETADGVLGALEALLIEALTLLHWSDLETLVDVIFSRNGWHRTSAIGGTHALTDLELEQPVTGERAAVQVKSRANQSTFDQYLNSIDDTQLFDRFFFICNEPQGAIVGPTGRTNVHVWTGDKLAETIFRMGLHQWVFDRVIEQA